MKLNTKLILSYLSVALLVLFTGYVGLQSIKQIEKEFTLAYQDNILTLQALEDIRFFALRFVSSSNEIALILSEYQAIKKTPENFQSGEQELIKYAQEGYKKALQTYSKLIRENFLDEIPYLEQIEIAGKELEKRGSLLVELKHKGVIGEEILETKEQFEGAERTFIKAVETAIEHEKKQLKEHNDQVGRTIALTNQIEIFAILLTFSLAVLFGVVISRRISLPILEIARAASKVEKGNLNVEVKVASKDEVGDLALSFQQMIQGLKSRDFLSNILSSMSDTLVVISTDAKIKQVNPALLNLLGYKEEELVGQGLQVLFNEKIFSEKTKLTEIVNSKLLSKSQEVEYKRKDGSLVSVSLSGSLVTDQENRIQAAILIAQDTTERRKSRLELERQKEWLEVTLSSIGDAIIITDEKEKVLFLNPIAEKLTGWSLRDAIGQNVELVFFIVNEDSRKVVENPIKKAISQGKVVGLANHTVLIGRDKKETHIDDSAAPIKYDNGKILGAVLVFRDISARRKSEKELLEAKKLAESATEAKSQFLATMSHEIRTPLNAVIGMSGLLLETPLAKEQQDFAQTIRSSSDNLLSILNNILDFSKIESGKLELEENPLDLRDTIEEALDIVSGKASEKGLELAYLVETDVPHSILGDVTRLRQILVNLLSNAVKFTSEGEVVVSLTSKSKQGSEHELLFSVKDTGIGIPPGRISKLFQSFSQVDVSTSRQYGGTGLGLAISKQLVELMGGQIYLESQEGKGTTFFFTIKALSIPSQPRPFLQSAKPQLEDKKLLIVDDNETNRKILTLQTQFWGMTAKTASSAKEALEFIRGKELFDLVILDGQMPEMSGAELAKEIHNFIKPQDLPIVMLTSFGFKKTENEGVKFAAYLTKPIKPAQLYKTLNEVFGKAVVKSKFKVPSIVSEVKSEVKSESASQLKILLADDNEVNQYVALAILKKLGYKADTANDGLEVLDMVNKTKYDLILMDVQMPKMDGLEATQQICSKFPKQERPKIVAVTANAVQGDKEKCLEAGMDSYVSKPIQIEELRKLIEAFKNK